MPRRIPEEEIDRIKRDTDLAALVRSRGIELGKHGNGHLKGLCPFHKDTDNPNFIVTPGKGLWHCMACGAAGNAIQFVERFDGVSFRHAFEILNEGAEAFSAPADNPTRWSKGDEVTRPLKRATIRRLENPFKPDAEDFELLDQTVDYYHEKLLKAKQPLDYLKKRGIYSEEAIKTFRLGYSDRTLGLRLPERNRKEGKAIRERLIKLGLIRDTGHEHFNGSLVLPIFDEQGHVAEMYGRKTRSVTAPTQPHLYLPGPHAGIWNPDALAGGELILCEAPLDALTFWVNGYKNVTFIFGTEAFPDYLFDAMLTHRIKTVRLAYDADDSGDRAAKRDIERLTSSGIEVYRIKFPRKMDVNEYARKVSPAEKSLALAIKSAEWCKGAVDTTHTRPGVNIDNNLAANLVANKKTPSTEPSAESVVEAPSLERQGEYHVMALGKRQYRIGGLEKNNSLEVLKVAVRIRHEEHFHLDSFDMTRDGEGRRCI